MGPEDPESGTGQETSDEDSQQQQARGFHGAGEGLESGEGNLGKSCQPQSRSSSAMADHCSAMAVA
jgi:hypothetical protein